MHLLVFCKDIYQNTQSKCHKVRQKYSHPHTRTTQITHYPEDGSSKLCHITYTCLQIYTMTSQDTWNFVSVL
jgi:hypothetical protein